MGFLAGVLLVLLPWFALQLGVRLWHAHRARNSRPSGWSALLLADIRCRWTTRGSDYHFVPPSDAEASPSLTRPSTPQRRREDSEARQTTPRGSQWWSPSPDSSSRRRQSSNISLLPISAGVNGDTFSPRLSPPPPSYSKTSSSYDDAEQTQSSSAAAAETTMHLSKWALRIESTRFNRIHDRIVRFAAASHLDLVYRSIATPLALYVMLALGWTFFVELHRLAFGTDPARTVRASHFSADSHAVHLGGYSILPLIPGLTLPLAHLPLLLLGLATATFIHEVYGHGFATSISTVASGRRSLHSDNCDIAKDDSASETLVRIIKTGFVVPLPGFIGAAFVSLPSSLFYALHPSRGNIRSCPSCSVPDRKYSTLPFLSQAHVVGAGIVANVASALLVLCVWGAPFSQMDTPLGSFASSHHFAPAPSAMLAYTYDQTLQLVRGVLPFRPSATLELSARARALVWSDDPIGSESGQQTSAESSIKGGLRVSKVENHSFLHETQELAAVQRGDVILSINDVSFSATVQADPAASSPSKTGDRRAESIAQHSLTSHERLQRWFWAMRPEAHTDEPGWCYDRRTWDTLPIDSCVAALVKRATPPNTNQTSSAESSPQMRLCFEERGRGANGTQDEPEKSIVHKIHKINFAELIANQTSTDTRCNDSSSCRQGICLQPLAAEKVVRLTLLDRFSSTKDQRALSSNTLFLQTDLDALARTLIVSPFIARAPVRVIVPDALSDGWLILVELALAYLITASFALALLNAAPLPGLDGDLFWSVVAAAIARASGHSGGSSKDQDEEQLDAGRDDLELGSNPSRRRNGLSRRPSSNSDAGGSNKQSVVRSLVDWQQEREPGRVALAVARGVRRIVHAVIAVEVAVIVFAGLL